MTANNVLKLLWPQYVASYLVGYLNILLMMWDDDDDGGNSNGWGAAAADNDDNDDDDSHANFHGV